MTVWYLSSVLMLVLTMFSSVVVTALPLWRWRVDGVALTKQLIVLLRDGHLDRARLLVASHSGSPLSRRCAEMLETLPTAPPSDASEASEGALIRHDPDTARSYLATQLAAHEEASAKSRALRAVGLVAVAPVWILLFYSLVLDLSSGMMMPLWLLASGTFLVSGMVTLVRMPRYLSLAVSRVLPEVIEHTLEVPLSATLRQQLHRLEWNPESGARVQSQRLIAAEESETSLLDDLSTLLEDPVEVHGGSVTVGGGRLEWSAQGVALIQGQEVHQLDERGLGPLQLSRFDETPLSVLDAPLGEVVGSRSWLCLKLKASRMTEPLRLIAPCDDLVRLEGLPSLEVVGEEVSWDALLDLIRALIMQGAVLSRGEPGEVRLR